jgi:hypothetical protein
MNALGSWRWRGGGAGDKGLAVVRAGIFNREVEEVE